MERSDLLDKKFQIMVTNILINVISMKENVRISKTIENIKTYQIEITELKVTVTELKIKQRVQQQTG